MGWQDAPVVTEKPEQPAWMAAPKVGPPEPPAAAEKTPPPLALRGQAGNLAGLGEAALNMGTGMIAKPVSDVMGMAATAKDVMTGNPNGDPAGFKRSVQEGMTYQPRTEYGRDIAQYNPLALLGQAISGAGRGVNRFVAPPETSGPMQAAFGNLAQEGIEQAPGLVGAKGGAKLASKIPEKQAALNAQKTLNAPLDTIRNTSQEAGLTTPPEGTSWLTAAPGMSKINRYISAKNQPEFNRLVADQFKLPEGTALSPEILKSVRSEAGNAYKKVVESGYGKPVTEARAPKVSESAILDAQGKPMVNSIPQPPVTRTPGLPVTESFKAPLKEALIDLETKLISAPETFGSLKPSARLIREYLKKDELDPRVAMDSLKQLRADAQTNFKSTNPAERAAGFTRMEIANGIENLFEENLQKTGQANLLAEFRDARKKIAQTYDVEKVLDAAGNVDAQKLATIAKKRPLTENLRLVSDYAKTFPKGAKKPVEGIQGLSPFDWMFAMAQPLHGAISAVGRAAVPEMAARGLMQNKTPTYQANRMTPDMLRALGIGGNAYAQQQLTPPPQ